MLFRSWDGSNLQVQGTINIQGGNAATTSSLNSATASLLTTINTTSQSLSESLAPNIFTDSTGQIRRPPSVLVNSSNGLFLGSSYLGYYSGSDWKTYMDNNGQFFLTGSATNYLKWSGSTLTISGDINIVGGNGNAATTTYTNNAQSLAVASASLYSSNAATSASNAYSSASAYSASAYSVANTLDSKIFTDANGKLNKTPTTASVGGLYLGSSYLGF